MLALGITQAWPAMSYLKPHIVYIPWWYPLIIDKWKPKYQIVALSSNDIQIKSFIKSWSPPWAHTVPEESQSAAFSPDIPHKIITFDQLFKLTDRIIMRWESRRAFYRNITKSLFWFQSHQFTRLAIEIMRLSRICTLPRPRDRLWTTRWLKINYNTISMHNATISGYALYTEWHDLIHNSTELSADLMWR